ncbi:MAG: glycosyltransferase [Actinobacteria bacterium]|nr:MAG: glycosyltransferase [Actinomycetota bacterium]
MKVLVVLAQPPLPEGEAPARCHVALLRGLRAHGLDVRAIAARQHYSVPGEPPDDLKVEIVPVPQTPRSHLARLVRPRGELAGGEFAARVAEAAMDVDVVHLEETQTSWADEGIATPSLVHLHYLARQDRSLGPPWRKQFRDVLEFSLAERAAISRHRHLVASSPLVADALRRAAPLADIALAPLSLDPAYYAPASLDGAPVVGMIGTAVWPPTAAAVRRLVAEVWPLVRRHVPDARLSIAGRGMDGVSGLGGEGVDVQGAVPSAVEFIRSLAVLLYPVARGSGVKVKVLEALACGVPVVTTAAGAEGIDPCEGVVVRESPQELADAASALLLDHAERRRLGSAVRSAFERLYTPERATEPLLALYRRMTA